MSMTPVDWANIPDPAEIPPAKFRLESFSQDVEIVVAVPPPPYEPVKVGELFFNGNEWLFIRVDRNGEQIMDGFHWIPVEPETEQKHRDMEVESRTKAKSQGVLDGHLAAIQASRNVYREESREDAKVGAIIEARKWWKLFHTST